MVEAAPMRLPELYRENIRMLVLVALPIHALLFAWGGLLSQLLVGAYQVQFVFFLQLSALAWFLNTFAGPAYFMNFGYGICWFEYPFSFGDGRAQFATGVGFGRKVWGCWGCLGVMPWR